jgi:CHAD domain-containing protein
VNVFARKSKRVFEGDTGALHSTRVACRRLREVLPVLQLDADTARKLRRRLRRATRRLGEVRDFDVLTSLVTELLRDRRYSRPALMALQAELKQARASACEALEAKLPPRKLQKLARRLKRVAKHVEPDDEGDSRQAKRQNRASIWALDALVVRRAGLLREAVTAAGTVYNPQALHDVRVAIKKLRYAVELRAEARETRATSEVSVLKSSQDLLGRLHDVQVLIEHARRLQSPPSIPDRPSTELKALVRILERDCRQLHARYIRGVQKLLALVGRLEKAGPQEKPLVRWSSRSAIWRRLA